MTKQMKMLVVLIFCIISNISAINNPFLIHISGKISCNKHGISSVPVTDGISIVITDLQGNYELVSRSNCQFVYYTLPTGYESPIEDGIPVFYQFIDKSKKTQIANFEIYKSKQSQLKHAFIMVGDPQVSNLKELEMLKSVITDMNTTSAALSTEMPVIAISTGDNVFDKHALFDNYKSVISKTDLPFYQVIGNHDLDYNERSDELSANSYSAKFGPVYYSYNIGKIHYVVLKDVFYYGYSYRYIGYITENQLSWLEKDMSQVKKGSTVIVSYHIPTIYGESEETENYDLLSNSVMNRDALFKILAPFKVHFMAGHSHTQWNTIISPFVFEHVHSAACSAWWQGLVGIDGTPKGYTVYLVNGDSLSWYYKIVGLDKNEQFKVYPVGADSLYPTSFIANVYNYDPAWTVKWYENNVLAGNMDQYWGEDPFAKSLYPIGKNKTYSWFAIGPTHHLFKAKVLNHSSKITVKVTDRFGNIYIKEISQKKK
jgi:hypothetical protein